MIDNRVYIGTVVDNSDPAKLSRVRVEIPELTANIAKDHLPWYPINYSVGFGKSGNLSGLIIPDVGSEVTVIFPYKDIYHGLVTGRYGITNKDFEVIPVTEPIIPNPKVTSPHDQKDYSSDYRLNYPNSSGFFDSIKNYFRLDKMKRTFELVATAFNSCKFKVDKDGNITLHITGKLKVVVEKDVTYHCKANTECITERDQRTYVMKNRYDLTDGNHTEKIVQSHYVSERFS